MKLCTSSTEYILAFFAFEKERNMGYAHQVILANYAFTNFRYLIESKVCQNDRALPHYSKEMYHTFG